MMNIHDWVKENLNNKSIVIEAGACEGLDTLFFSNIVNKIYSFEPIPALYNKALINVEGRENVELHNLALSDKNGKEKMYVSDRLGEYWGSSSLLKPKEHLKKHTEITFKEEIEINTINLDDWYLKNNLSRIDMLWLDLQGYEPIVLKSSPNILKNTKYLYTEVALVENYENNIKYEDFKIFLNDSGFEVIHDGIYWEDGGNVLFKNKNIE
jgi:FkbM family methyltransferase